MRLLTCSSKRVLTFLPRKSLQRVFVTRGVVDPIKTPKFDRNPWERLRDTFDEDQRAELVIPAFKQSLFYGHRMAIKDPIGEFTYFQLYISAKRLSLQLSNLCGSGASRNVPLLCANNFLTPLAQWTCWISGQIAMPLNAELPFEQLKSQVEDSNSLVLIATPEYEELATKVTKQLEMALMVVNHDFVPPAKIIETELDKQLLTAAERVVVECSLNNDFYTSADAFRLYTKGTTGKPKAVTLTHKNLDALVKMVVEAYRITDYDSMLHVRSKQYSYASIMSLMYPLSIGGKIIMQDQFNSESVWNSLLGINTPVKERPNIIMADPTVYAELIASYDKVFASNKKMVDFIHKYCKKHVRLMTSSSSALPPEVFNRWNAITGHNIIENYGMTECGMALSNPYVQDKNRERTAGNVGLPLPGTMARLIDAKTRSPLLTYEGRSNSGYWAKEEKTTLADNVFQKVLPRKRNMTPAILMPPTVGEFCIRGPHVFREYPEELEMTENLFIEEDFFRTGDMAVFENGAFKIIERAKKPTEEISTPTPTPTPTRPCADKAETVKEEENEQKE